MTIDTTFSNNNPSSDKKGPLPAVPNPTANKLNYQGFGKAKAPPAMEPETHQA